MTKVQVFAYSAPLFSLPKKLTEFLITREKNTYINFSDIIKRTEQISGKYIIVINKNVFTFITIDNLLINNETNGSFGVKGFRCPAAYFIYKVLNKQIGFLNNLCISILNKPEIYKNNRNVIIKNKKNIIIYIKKRLKFIT